MITIRLGPGKNRECVIECRTQRMLFKVLMETGKSCNETYLIPGQIQMLVTIWRSSCNAPTKRRSKMIKRKPCLERWHFGEPINCPKRKSKKTEMLKLKGHLKIEQLKESLYDMLFEWSKKNLFVKHFQLVSMNEWKETYLSIASVSWKAELLLIQFNTNVKPILSSQLNTTRNKDTQNLFEKRGIYTGHHKVMKVVPINILSTKNCTNCNY